MSLRGVEGVRRAGTLVCWLFRGNRPVAVLGCVLVCFDLGFMLLHLAALLWLPGNRMLYIDVDRGYAEIFQALKYTMAALLLCGAAATRKRWSLVLWLPVLAVLLLDDLFQGHESAGSYVHRTLLPQAGDWVQDAGAVCTLLLGALAVGALLWVGYTRASSSTRWVYRVLVALLVLLAVFTVGVGLLGSLVPERTVLADVLTLVEDGGEMLVVSGFVVVAARLLGPLPAAQGV
ncbi:hypothetical protein [Actinomyces wuliandei]|uniref:hypothetical protein n=1 Tax=Actinomyces wuliandei TaxID=2057743 RepID=UPI000FDB975E|nr:hypothetical protein [Actinomyces wuliandei]